VVVYDLTGRVLAHGGNPRMVGNNLIGMLDAEGKPFVKQRIELARTKENVWLDYKFSDPVTNRIWPKSTYCERLESTAVCVEVYKR
jgi:cytochrome c